MSDRRILIVIPAFNENFTIKSIVERCSKYGHVLVINDGSSDGTGEIAEAAGAFVVWNGSNKGYEYALNSGYKYAQEKRYDLMITMDADGQLPPERIPAFLRELNAGNALVVGKRKKITRFCERFLSFVSTHVGVICDPYCGMKGYDLSVLKKSRFSAYNSVGTALALDYVEQGYSAANVDISVNKRDGESRFGGVWISEFRLLSSMVAGCYRLCKIRCSSSTPGIR